MSNIKLRELKSKDMFTMFGILSKMKFTDIKEKLTPERVKELVKTFDKAEEKSEEESSEEKTENKSEENITYLGFNIIFEITEIIIQNLPCCENEVYKLLADLSGMSIEEISELSMATFTEMIIDVIKKDEFKDFFKVVSGLFK